MRAIVIHDAHDLRIEDRTAPEPGPGEVLVRVNAGGVCGSDLHYYNHGGFGSVRLKEPMILGHEVSGTIETAGEGVTGLAPGDLVAVSPSRPCGTCRFCAMGMQNQCLNMRFYGSAMPFPHIQGAFRELLVADAAQCVPAAGLSAGEAAMAEPLSVALHGARQAGELLGARVLVTGAGPIGNLCVLAARRAGARQIVVTDIAAASLEFAEKVGADIVLNTAEDKEALAPYTAEKGQFDVLFECSGAAPALAGAIPALRPGAAIVQLGLGGDMTLPMMQLTAKELCLRGSFRFHEEFAVAVELMQAGLIDVSPLITHSLPLEDAERAFVLASDRASGVMKAQISFV